ncbi:hypothetical protein ACFPM3_18305 [Streptomyces coeruleoprunus]|uniref:Uncharacterized protein n=1 Tax=Streptomyces coeruleoprunus TaxID=285563 RepID=A0ABV9XI98_9ACTN
MNLVRNGGFSEYTFKQRAQWGTGNRGVMAAGRHNGDQFLSLAGWTWGKYTGHGKTEYPAEAQDAVDLINGAADGHFPEDGDHPFASTENFLDMNGSSTLGFIEQTVPVTGGQAYELSFYHGYNVWPGHDTGRPTYLRVEVESDGRQLLCEDYVQYYSGKGGKASHSDDRINAPAWRKRRLSFRVPEGRQQVTVRFANPGRAGLHPELGADPDGHSGMQLAHVRLEGSGGGSTLLTVAQRKPEQTKVRQGQIWQFPVVLTLTNAGNRRIGTHRVVFTAPEGLYFMEDRLVMTRQEDDPTETPVAAERSNGNRTLTCPAFPLELAPEKWASVYPAMGVDHDATPGTATVAFEVGSPVFATGHATVTILPLTGA